MEASGMGSKSDQTAIKPNLINTCYICKAQMTSYTTSTQNPQAYLRRNQRVVSASSPAKIVKKTPLRKRNPEDSLQPSSICIIYGLTEPKCSKKNECYGTTKEPCL